MRNPNNPANRHSGAGRNPEKTVSRKANNTVFVPLSRVIFNWLDSGLRRNDDILV